MTSAVDAPDTTAAAGAFTSGAIAAATIRDAVRAASACGTTPRGATSSERIIRDAPAMNPRASATFAAQIAHAEPCASIDADGPGSNAPSSHV